MHGQEQRLEKKQATSINIKVGDSLRGASIISTFINIKVGSFFIRRFILSVEINILYQLL